VRPVEDGERELVLLAMRQHGRMTCDKMALILADPHAGKRAELVLRTLEDEGKVECVDEWSGIRSYALKEIDV
jgi:hypothetical protein